MFEFILERYNYWIFIMLMMTGLYIVISRSNLVKKLIGLNLFQQREARHIRQPQIQHHTVKYLGFQESESFLAGVRGENGNILAP